MDRRKELKLEYKMTERPKGVFQVRNLMNNKIYVKSSPNLDGAKNSLWTQLKFGTHFLSKTLVEDWKAFGEENFVFEVLEQLESDLTGERDDRKELEKMEERWLEKLQPYGTKGYNTPKRNTSYLER